jgi:hypothetical protein
MNAKTAQPAEASRGPAEGPNVPPENIAVSNRLVTVQDAALSADLFALMLRAVRAEKADQEKNCNGIIDL